MRPIFPKLYLWLGVGLFLLATLSACGRKGELVLPDSAKPAPSSQQVDR